MGILTLYEFGVRPFGTTEHPKCGSHCFGHWGSQPHIILGSGPSEPQSTPSWAPIALAIGDPKCTPTLQIPMQCGSIHGVNGDPNTPQVWDRAMMDPGTPQIGVPLLWPLGIPTPHHFGVRPFGTTEHPKLGSHCFGHWGSQMHPDITNPNAVWIHPWG